MHKLPAIEHLQRLIFLQSVLGAFGGIRVTRHLFSFLCCAFDLFFFVLCLVSNVVCVSGLSIPDSSSGFSNICFVLGTNT